MDLKNYQRRVLDEVRRFLDAIERQRSKGNSSHASLDAWHDIDQHLNAQARLGLYTEHANGLGIDTPHFGIKVPTGGGKTLLATQILGAVHETLLKDRNGAGLVLWVVPSSQIYNDTLRRLRDRNDFYRLMLEHALSRRIEIWEKHELARLSPARLRDCLNILVVQLAATNRETKEQLKFFADSGGNITQHFPPENDSNAHRALKEKFPNLDMIENDPVAGRHLCKTSVGNLVRLCLPAVILDEGHRATSDLARKTLKAFNASAVVELSATPHRQANIISRVSGQELLDEEMIKLPLNVAASRVRDWRDVLALAKDRRQTLAAHANEYATTSKAACIVRPIVLVQVERTGKDQRDGKVVHSEDVREHLTERLGVLPAAIAIKSAQTDDIEGIDLLADGCPVEWIITKSALQEGWDCPYAYILVSLNNTGSAQAMTQLVGRILRQPDQTRLPEAFDDLNQSYVYCLHKGAAEITKEVKTALEKEGYEGDAASLIRDASDVTNSANLRIARMRQEFADLYRTPFKGKIYLPRFCVKTGNDYESLDYFRHLIRHVDVDNFAYNAINWNLADDLKDAKERFYRISIGTPLERNAERDIDHIEPDAAALAWLASSLPFEFLSYKQLERIAAAIYSRLAETSPIRDRLSLVKFLVRDHAHRFVQQQVDEQTENVFRKLFDAGRIRFYLECAECRHEIPPFFEVRSARPLMHENGDAIAKSLFDYVEEEKNNSYETAVALCLDRDANVLWWYRNLVGSNQFSIQGYRKNRIHPDFVIQSGQDQKPVPRVIVLESKGKHLQGNEDTQYKRKVAQLFEHVGKEVTWQQLGEEFKDHVFRFQVLDENQEYGRDWKDELCEILSLA
jgi:type III restriction enzyme